MEKNIENNMEAMRLIWRVKSFEGVGVVQGFRDLMISGLWGLRFTTLRG